jgi:D-alanine-D-alanine ligase
VTAAPIALRALSDAPFLVWVLVPVVETDDADIAWYSDFEQSKAEYERAFAALGFAWRWQPVTLADHREVIAAIVRDSVGHEPVVLNLCDGDEVNGSPGLSIIRCLREHGLRYTGADERFYDVTTSKIVMKEAFERAGVPTSPWAVIPRDGAGIAGVIKQLGVPLILKPAVSAGSLGITTKSVVLSPQACAPHSSA